MTIYTLKIICILLHIMYCELLAFVTRPTRRWRKPCPSIVATIVIDDHCLSVVKTLPGLNPAQIVFYISARYEGK